MATASLTATSSTALKIKPVMWWAALGAVFVMLGIYVWSSWVFGGTFVPTPTGPDPVPTYMIVLGRANEVLFFFLFIFLLYWYAFRPRLREGRMSIDGLMYLALLTCFWQDPVQSMWSVTYVFNTALYQWGSWANYIPFWELPDGHRYSEPILIEGLGWACAVLPLMILANYGMRKAKERWPSISNPGLVGIAFAILFVITFLVEIPWMMAGVYCYPSAIKGLTLFHGHYYQLPIYETLYWTVNWTLLSCVRYFINDRGESYVERGVTQIRTTSGIRTTLRFLAIAGVFNVIVLFSYQLPHALTAKYFGDPWPEDIASRSYFRNYLCGPDTGRACP